NPKANIRSAIPIVFIVIFLPKPEFKNTRSRSRGRGDTHPRESAISLRSSESPCLRVRAGWEKPRDSKADWAWAGGNTMDADRNFKPFRWDLSRREQLPQVPLSSMAVFRHWPQVKYSPDFDSELRICAARVIAAAGDTDWVFVGRSPEHLFDYLSGIFESVPNAPALTHLLFSLRYGGSASSTAANNPVAMAALSSYFAAERLHPSAIAARERGVTFIDVVDSGTTFRNLIECLKLWNNRHKGDWNAVQRRLRFIGLTPRKKTSP